MSGEETQTFFPEKSELFITLLLSIEVVAVPFAVTMCHESTKGCPGECPGQAALCHLSRSVKVNYPYHYIYFFLSQSTFPSSTPWEAGCRSGKQKYHEYIRKTRVGETNPTSTLDFWICVFSRSVTQNHVPHPGGQCASSAGHCPRVGSLTEPLIDHLNIQISWGHTPVVAARS